MDDILELLAQVVMGGFLLGVAGCGLTIPVVAVKFFRVLFEKDEEHEMQGPAPGLQEK